MCFIKWDFSHAGQMFNKESAMLHGVVTVFFVCMSSTSSVRAEAFYITLTPLQILAII